MGRRNSEFKASLVYISKFQATQGYLMIKPAMATFGC